jgi:hypothetical protein
MRAKRLAPSHGKSYTATTGTNNWHQQLAPTTGANNWHQQLAPTTGTNNWHQQLAPTTGANNWYQQLVPTTWRCVLEFDFSSRQHHGVTSRHTNTTAPCHLILIFYGCRQYFYPANTRAVRGLSKRVVARMVPSLHHRSTAAALYRAGVQYRIGTGDVH